jgi:UDP-N-acetylmuramate: L-alanyl-gamma-D-glutamyl-meso-diaminopimelate ligase
LGVGGPEAGPTALSAFAGVHRRQEVRAEHGGVTVYDDFAHHPTAIATTIAGLRERHGDGRILAIPEPRSATMRQGVHRRALAAALDGAERTFAFEPGDLPWDLGEALAPLGERASVFTELDALVAAAVAEARPGDALLVMSNGPFGGIHEQLAAALAAREAG